MRDNYIGRRLIRLAWEKQSQCPLMAISRLYRQGRITAAFYPKPAAITPSLVEEKLVHLRLEHQRQRVLRPY